LRFPGASVHDVHRDSALGDWHPAVRFAVLPGIPAGEHGRRGAIDLADDTALFEIAYPSYPVHRAKPHCTALLHLITGMRLRTLALPFIGLMAWGQSLDQGKRAFDRGDYAAAARFFEQAQQASPNCEILFFLGLARYRLKQPDLALIAFRS